MIAAAVALAGCPGLLGRNGKKGPQQPLQAAVSVLKRADARLPQMAFAKFESFKGNKLYTYMDGAAEAYFAKGFRCLGAADVQWKKTEAKIEAFEVDSAKHARALFDNFNDGKGKALPAGEHSAAWDARELEGIFHRGAFFCRIIVYGSDAAARQMLHALAEAIDKSIPR